MGPGHFTDDFKRDAVAQITERGQERDAVTRRVRTAARDVARRRLRNSGLFNHIKSEKSYFEGCMKPDDLGSVLCVNAKRTNNRIKSQSGAFLLFGHEALLPEWGNEGIEVSRVPIMEKAKILTQLDAININATTVYPSIEQTTVHLRDQHLVRPAE